ncbi:hypothetical protein ACFXJ8_23090 [Nonomuraea sp. NPDC059194]|uniref:hypothetical protein n=1 Tax=Nonomuraea sp. NPDC059194 TaxID=3346764 RepID=UPI00369323BF
MTGLLSTRIHVLALAFVGALVTGCGAVPEPAAGSQASAQEAGGCPLAVADLSQATSLAWELKEKRDDHLLETLESVKATVCLYTAKDSPQEGGDPLALRADVVKGKDAATVAKDFRDTCADTGGKIRGETTATCERAGAVVEGLVADADRTVNVYLVNADKSTATKLTPAFDAILSAVGKK